MNESHDIPLALKSHACLYSQERSDIEAWLEKHNEKKYRAQQLFDHLYTQRQPFDELTTWPAALHTAFARDFSTQLQETRYNTSRDHTHKWLYSLNDGNYIETVLMEYPTRSTVCISSQAGCAMGCTFCATGQAGFDRHLTTGEILEQVARACMRTSTRVSNIVFMGMGEPLANVKAVRRACERLVSDFGFSARHITVSTVGIVPGMRDMTTWDIPVTLALSLHSPFDDMRTELVPINKRYPISDILNAAADVSHVHGRRVSFEYAAIDDENVTVECAHELGRILRNYDGAGGAHINVIPLNHTTFFEGQAAHARTIQEFAGIVRTYGHSVTIRRNRGTDIDAACGQLRERATSDN